MFDAVSVIILMEHTLMSCLFGAEPPPNVMFKDHHEYIEAKVAILYRLGLDGALFEEDWKKGEIKCRSRSPSPIKRLEDSMFLAGQN